MVTVKYGDYEEIFPYPTPLQLLTVIRIGVRRMYERNDGFELPKTYEVYLNERRMAPADANQVVGDDSIIELKYIDPARSTGVTLFQLDL